MELPQSCAKPRNMKPCHFLTAFRSHTQSRVVITRTYLVIGRAQRERSHHSGSGGWSLAAGGEGRARGACKPGGPGPRGTALPRETARVKVKPCHKSGARVKGQGHVPEPKVKVSVWTMPEQRRHQTIKYEGREAQGHWQGQTQTIMHS